MNSTSEARSMQIECIDFGSIAPEFNLNDEENKDEWLKVSEKLTSSFEDIGFAYIKNHGIPEELIGKMHELGSTFFSLPEDVKEKYSKTSVHGYVQQDRERLYKDESKLELRESFDIRTLWDAFPSEAGQFRETTAKFTEPLKKLSFKLLRCLEIGLDVPNGTFLTKHMMPLSMTNSSILRIIHYPPIPPNTSEGVVRCGSHSDYGTITLLFQDNMGGLEVKNRNGLWVKADPIPGTILINVGDLLEMWTAGRFIATKHRVLVPKEEVKRRCSRRSMVFFIHPDDSVMVKTLDGSSTYPPKNARQHLLDKYSETYRF